MDRTEQVMQDFEMIQQTNKPDADEVITRRQEVNAVWSGLQLMVEDRKLLIKKAIKFYTTYDDVFQALDSLKKEYSDKSGEIYDPEISDRKFSKTKFIFDSLIRNGTLAAAEGNRKACSSTEVAQRCYFDGPQLRK